ncbi:hypothetical protein TorRG33x02_090710, partial [Trema orientale]
MLNLIDISLKEKVEEGVLELIYTSTNSQVADILTKSLPRVKFEDLISKLGMISSLRGSVEFQSCLFLISLFFTSCKGLGWSASTTLVFMVHVLGIVLFYYSLLLVWNSYFQGLI